METNVYTQWEWQYKFMNSLHTDKGNRNNTQYEIKIKKLRLILI